MLLEDAPKKAQKLHRLAIVSSAAQHSTLEVARGAKRSPDRGKANGPIKAFLGPGDAQHGVEARTTIANDSTWHDESFLYF